MDIDDFLRNAEYSTNKELVGLCIYFLEEYENYDRVATSDVKELLEQSRAAINPSAIPRRIKDLREDGLVTKVGEENHVFHYILTHEGLDLFFDLSGDSEKGDKVRDTLFIQAGIVDVEYYSTLIDHINLSFQYGINDACLILTRKLFENLVIDILRAEYGGEGINLYFNTETGRFYGLGTLCGNLRDKTAELKHYSRQLDGDLVSRVEQFKEHGNSQAHSVRVDIDDDELEGMSDEATQLTEILYDIREEIRIANG